jgi:hypothetical protein
MAAERYGDGDGEGGRSAGATSRVSVRLRRLGQGTAAREEIVVGFIFYRVWTGRSGFIIKEADDVRMEEIVVEFDVREEIDDCTEIVEEADVVRSEIVEEEKNVIHSSRVRD